MADKFMTIGEMEDIRNDSGEVVGVQVWSPTGESLKIKKGQGGKLKARWGELEIGKAYSFEMGEYKGYPFVQDFRAVAGELAKKALEKVEAKQVDTTRGSIERQVALKEVGKLVVADKIPVEMIPKYFYQFAHLLADEKLGGVTPEVQKAPEATEEEPIKYITLEQRKRIDELAKQNNFSKLQIAEIVKTQGWKASSVKGLSQVEGDLLILLMDIGAVAEEEEA